jgi:DNA-binding transcriptional ArsR family regulator
VNVRWVFYAALVSERVSACDLPPGEVRADCDRAKRVVVVGALKHIYALTAICLQRYVVSKVTAPFATLAEPQRRRILDLLLAAERPVGAIVDELGISQPAVSKHLRVLREAGLVDVKVDAQHRIYRVRGEPLQAVDEWLEPYRRLWASRLDALERHLDSTPD